MIKYLLGSLLFHAPLFFSIWLFDMSTTAVIMTFSVLACFMYLYDGNADYKNRVSAAESKEELLFRIKRIEEKLDGVSKWLN